MLNDKLRSELEQSMEAIVELNPPMWWGLFEGSKEKGFTDVQALELVKTYILSQSIGGVKGT